MLFSQDNNLKKSPTSLGFVKGLNAFYEYLCVLACIIFLVGITTISNPVSAAPLITNTATANFSINGNNGQLSDSIQFEKNTVVITPDVITLTKQANTSTAEIGELITYTLRVDNSNDSVLDHLVIQDILPAGLSYITNSAKLNNSTLSNSQISNSNNLLNITLGSIPENTVWTIKYQAKALNTGVLINKAKAISDTATSANTQSTVTITEKIRTPSTINFLKISDAGTNQVIPPTSYNDDRNGGKHWQEINQITLADGSIASLPTPQPIVNASQYNLLDPIIIELKDLDQNLDPTSIEMVIVTVTVPGTNDKEILLLQEISPDSGIFKGVILSTNNTSPSNLQDGLLSLITGSKIKVTYRDEEDVSDTSATAAIVVPKSKLILSKTANKDTASLGELVRYSLSFTNTSGFQITNISLEDKLPLGFKYVPNTILLNGAALNQTTTFDGRILTSDLGNMPTGASWTVSYLTKITAGVQVGDAVNVAQIKGDNIASNLAKATVEIKDDLLRTHNILTGRVYIGCNTKNDVRILKDARIYLETGRNVLSDEEGFWHMEGVQAGSHVLQLDKDSLEGYEPILCTNNTRHAGDAKSQFVDLEAGTLWQVDFFVKESKDRKNISSNLAKQKDKKIDPITLYGKKYLNTAEQGFKILWPKNNYVPTVASTKIVIQSSPSHKVELFLNGKKVSALNYNGSNTNKERTITIKRWIGVDIDISRNNNTLLAIIKDKSGKEIARKTHNIHFSGEPDSAEFLPEKSILVADGKTTPVIALLIKDSDGFPMRANTHGYFSIKSRGHQIKTQREDNDRLNLNESTSGSYKYHIEENGIAYIELNPTTQSGQVDLNIEFKDKKKTIKAWLTPKLREWIMVGIAEGTVAHKKLSGNIKALDDLDKSEKTYKRGRVAFFAKGKVKGKYLLTVAYDTHKKKRDNDPSLEAPINTIDPDAWYTIYADNSHSQYDAPSSEKLYVKIEKNNYYTVFGDFQTGLTVTELTKYERVLTGIKSEYKGKRFEYNAFVSETSNKHHHEEIPGDGTSGLYHLSNNIVTNSEKIKIETRDRFHSEIIVGSRELTRYQDYEIDYDAGTLFFKFPINGRDQNFNPNLIVIDYDSETDSEKSIIAGGRVAVNTNNEKLEVGLSIVHLDRNKASRVKNDDLVGIDASYQLTPDTKIHAEIAQSKSSLSKFNSRTAQILEIEKQIAKMEAKAYYRKQEKDFGIGSEGSVSNIESGTKKVGAELRYKLNEKTDINGEVSQQDNLSNSNQRRLAEINLNHHYKQFETTVGLRHSKEVLEDERINSNSLLLGGKYTTKNGKVSLRSNIEKGFNNDNGSELNPDRLTVGVDVKLKEGLTLFAEHEITDNGDVETHNNRVGVNKSLWKGAQAKTTYTQERTNQEQRNYATLGLSQKIKVTDKIRADISIDHAKTLSGSQKKFNDNEPNIDGPVRDDYTAFTVGLGANEKDYSWTTRLEFRNGDLEDKINYTAGLIRHLRNGKQISAKLSFYDSDNKNGEVNKVSTLSFGSAWHPKEKDFVFFNRLDLIDDKSTATDNGTNDIVTQKIIHNMHYNRKVNHKTQVGLHHGIKHVIDINDQTKEKATIDTGTIQVRRDISKKVDIGIRGGYLRDWTEKTTETVAGISVGITPMKNAWIELGYNFEGFDDKNFDENNYKRKGPYASFRYKFNQDSFDGKDLPVRNKQKADEQKAKQAESPKNENINTIDSVFVQNESVKEKQTLSNNH